MNQHETPSKDFVLKIFDAMIAGNAFSSSEDYYQSQWDQKQDDYVARQLGVPLVNHAEKARESLKASIAKSIRTTAPSILSVWETALLRDKKDLGMAGICLCPLCRGCDQIPVFAGLCPSCGLHLQEHPDERPTQKPGKHEWYPFACLTLRDQKNIKVEFASGPVQATVPLQTILSTCKQKGIELPPVTMVFDGHPVVFATDEEGTRYAMSKTGSHMKEYKKSLKL